MTHDVPRSLRFLLVLLLVVGGTGCGVPRGLSQHMLDVGGVSRSYYLHVPVDAPADAPLVLVFHGGGSDSTTGGKNMHRFTGFNDIADRDGFVVAYPNSLAGNWNDGRVGHGAEDVDDLAYVDAMLDDIAGRAAIDRLRVYSVGISNGGFFSLRLACDRADAITAVYSIAATMPEGIRERCAPARPIPVAWAMGTDDPLVAYHGGPVAPRRDGTDRGTAADLDDAAAGFVAHNACTEQTEQDWDDLDPDDGSTVHETVHSGCTAGAEVRVLRIEGGGHTWPGGSQYAPAALIGTTNRDFDASEDAWAWFARFSR